MYDTPATTAIPVLTSLEQLLDGLSATRSQLRRVSDAVHSAPSPINAKIPDRPRTVEGLLLAVHQTHSEIAAELNVLTQKIGARNDELKTPGGMANAHEGR